MSSENASPKLGEAWRVDLEPVKGHEQGGRGPCLIVSVDDFDHIFPADWFGQCPSRATCASSTHLACPSKRETVG